MAKFQAPDLSNATPEFLVDEMAKLSIVENYSKKLRAVYKTALYARVGVDPTQEVKDQDHAGEKFIGHIEQYDQSRLDGKGILEKYPDIHAEFYKSSKVTKTTFKLKSDAINPELAKLMKELYAELGLEDVTE